jgi:hypothetical protein
VQAHSARTALLAHGDREPVLTLIGVTGHQELPPKISSVLVRRVRDVLENVAPPLGVITALAAGADQLVAREVLQQGGTLHAIVPAANYESTLFGDARRLYDQLLDKADGVTHLNFPEPSEDAYWAAGKETVDRCDLLIAIWDGKPARGLGGTGDVVEYARTAGKDVRIIWPSEAVRA